MVMDINPPDQVHIFVDQVFHLRCNAITRRHALASIDTNGYINHQVRTEAMGMHFFDAQNIRQGCQQAVNLARQSPAGDGIHQVS